MYRNILLTADGSPYTDWCREAALQLAVPGGKVNVLHVVDIVVLEGTFLQDLSGAVGAEPFLNLSPKLEKILTDKGNAIIENQVAAIRKAGFEASGEVATGIVSNVIARKAVESELVVMGRHGKHARFAEGFAGSATEGLLRKSPRPVLIVNKEPVPLKKVLLGAKPKSITRLSLASPLGPWVPNPVPVISPVGCKPAPSVKAPLAMPPGNTALFPSGVSLP